MSSMKKNLLAQNNSGFVSMIVTITIAIILTSITIVFVYLMIREQRQSLDRQLSAQAFYAAESGVNYAIKADLDEVASCPTGTPAVDPFYDPLNNRPGDTKNIKYTCILTTDKPPDLIYDDISMNNSTTFFIKNRDGINTLSELSFSWDNYSGTGEGRPNNANDGYPKFFPADTWGGGIGVLEISIYPIDTPTISSDRLKNDSRTFYLYPEQGGPGTTTKSYNDLDGQILKGFCANGNVPKKCNGVTITGLDQSPANPGPGVTAESGFMVRMRSIYNPASLQITGKAGASDFRLEGGQRIVDVTARASDVLRRIQVRIPIRPKYELPVFGIETADNLCKLLETSPAGSSDGCPL